jgi:hypothetical protein
VTAPATEPTCESCGSNDRRAHLRHNGEWRCGNCVYDLIPPDEGSLVNGGSEDAPSGLTQQTEEEKDNDNGNV